MQLVNGVYFPIDGERKIGATETRVAVFATPEQARPPILHRNFGPPTDYGTGIGLRGERVGPGN